MTSYLRSLYAMLSDVRVVLLMNKPLDADTNSVKSLGLSGRLHLGLASGGLDTVGSSQHQANPLSILQP